MPTDNGYSNQKKKGIAQFETVHNLGSGAYGKSIAPKSLYQISLVSESIVSVSDILGSDGQVQFWNIQITAHGAAVGNVLRINAGALINAEYEIIKVINANNFYILPITDIKPAALDSAVIMGWVTTRVTSDGSANVVVAPTAVSYNLDGSLQTVDQDTSVPANNKALPSLGFILKDGDQVPITKDTVTPANTVGLPVEIVGASGAEINITAGDINIQTTDVGVNFDSMRIGDGSGNYIEVNASNEALVHDADALTKLQSIDDKIIDDGAIITSNCSTTPLAGGASFTGTAFEVTKYSAINVGVFSDVASATNGVKVEFSPDGTNWDHSHSTTYTAASGVGYIFNCEFKYARVVYTNGSSAQSSFRLQTIAKKNFTKPSLYTVNQSVTGNMFVELGKNVIVGETTGGGGGFVNVKVNPSGALAVEASLAAGTNNIGDVDVLSLPSIPAGTNNIGDVDVASLPVSFNTGAADATTQRVVIASSQTVPISAASLPLPSGAATDAKLDTIITAIGNTNTKLDSIETNTSPELNSHSTQTVTSASAVTFTAPAGAKRMVIQNSLNAGGAIRFVASANTPTASSGFYLGVGQSTSEIAAGSFKAIATTASEDGDVTVIWFV
jgi:hypothetical protein